MKALVDPTKCAGIGLCEATAPSVFEVGDDGLGRVVVDEVSADDVPAVQEAIGNCPARALALAD
ncbi:ferredoxin [Mycobacterium barrassiae]|uniref:ferredoxin n=1 Tax=Mycobacterium barrassiae TaxID=319709 RepID=UPI002265CE6B|nr:ferredoxin [Mycobacterium barrassiae]MCV7299433.1 ferredoxin [Mycobacterium barrassiae]